MEGTRYDEEFADVGVQPLDAPVGGLADEVSPAPYVDDVRVQIRMSDGFMFSACLRPTDDLRAAAEGNSMIYTRALIADLTDKLMVSVRQHIHDEQGAARIES